MQREFAGVEGEQEETGLGVKVAVGALLVGAGVLLWRSRK